MHFMNKKARFLRNKQGFYPFFRTKMHGAGNMFQPCVKGFFHILF